MPFHVSLALSYEVLGIQKHPHAHKVDEFQCVSQLKQPLCGYVCTSVSLHWVTWEVLHTVYLQLDLPLNSDQNRLFQPNSVES